MRVRLLAVLLTVTAMATLAGCGDDEKTTTATEGTTATTNASTEETTDSTAAGNVGAITSARCVQAASSLGKVASSMQTAFNGAAPDLDSSVDELRAFASAAPSEIRSDFETVAEGYATVIKALRDANFDPSSGKAPSPDDAAKIQAATSSLNNTDFTAAAQRVSDWFVDKCGK